MFTITLSLSDFEPSDFWNWSSFSDYLQCVLSMIVVISLLTYAFVDSSTYVEGIGTLSLFTESTLALPQLFKNFYSGSTQGMRLVSLNSLLDTILFTVTLVYVQITLLWRHFTFEITLGSRGQF